MPGRTRQEMVEMEAYIERFDGKIAKIELKDDDKDPWDSIMESYPESFDGIDENGVIWDAVSGWNESFGPEEDLELAVWLMGAEDYTTAEGTVGPMSYHAQLDNPVSGRMWVDWGENGDGTHLIQHVTIDRNDLLRLILGHDPIAEGWKDEDGNQLAPGNARRE